jgi:hypothetical protein
MSKLRFLTAVVAGLALATLPFLHYAIGDHVHGTPHMDHSPHHGGQLGMSGDHHVEIVRERGRVEVFVSDAHRRPLDVVKGRATFDGTTVVSLAREEDRLVGYDVGSAHEVQVQAELGDGTKVTIDFVLPET